VTFPNSERLSPRVSDPALGSRDRKGRDGNLRLRTWMFCCTYGMWHSLEMLGSEIARNEGIDRYEDI